MAKTGEPEFKLSHVKRREIQAEMAALLIEAFTQAVGREKTMEIVTKAIAEDAVLSGRKLAARYSGNTMEVLSRIVKEVWAEDDAMKMTIISETDDELHFDVTHCGYTEAYRRLGILDLGVVLSCSRDFVFPEGFNPDIELVRTKTIMEGADCCDFRYRRKKR